MQWLWVLYLQDSVKEQNISGNLDVPEGGFDALMQVAVCEDVSAWYDESCVECKMWETHQIVMLMMCIVWLSFRHYYSQLTRTANASFTVI